MWCCEGCEPYGAYSQASDCCPRSIPRFIYCIFLRLSDLTLHQDSGMLSLGDTGELSPNASAMLRISTLSAWAQLQIASSHQTYLADVVKPYRTTLASLWIAALRDYASIRVDSEFLHDASSVALDSSYSSLGKEVLLPVRLIFLFRLHVLIRDLSIMWTLGQSFFKPSPLPCRQMILIFSQPWTDRKSKTTMPQILRAIYVLNLPLFSSLCSV